MSDPIQTIPGIQGAIAAINARFDKAIEKATPKKRVQLPESDEYGLVDCKCGHQGFEKETSGDGLCVNCDEDRYNAIKGQVVRLPDGSLGKVHGRDSLDFDRIVVGLGNGDIKTVNAWELSLQNENRN